MPATVTDAIATEANKAILNEWTSTATVTFSAFGNTLEVVTNLSKLDEAIKTTHIHALAVLKTHTSLLSKIEEKLGSFMEHIQRDVDVWIMTVAEKIEETLVALENATTSVTVQVGIEISKTLKFTIKIAFKK